MHRICLLFWLLMAPNISGAESDGVTPWRQDEPPNQPYSPQEAISKMKVPDGFTVELVASEPDIVNPIAMSFDDRGRIWITESIEYPRKRAGVGRDRLKILEDTNGDGRANNIKVFAEGLNIPTGVAVGYGGVWVLNAPDLLFLRENNGKESSREVVLSGFGRTDTHELPNSLTWGPDGWLYGLNGVFNQSRVHSNNGKEYKFNCALWRVHPRTHEFQVVCEGTSNPFGIAWDTEGSAIVEACHWANDHLFHFVETGHYQRQAGAFPPFTIPIGSITDHGHQKTAYCGIAFLDTDAYPVEYRERIVVGNIHGGAINMDRLQSNGATYLAKGEPDLFTANDAWCMPVALKVGPDGCLYVLDWYDRYHCSQDAARDPDGVDRLKGRLYRLRYKNNPRSARIDLASQSDDELITRLASGNIYFRETAQRILTERLGSASAGLRPRLEQLVLPSEPVDPGKLGSDFGASIERKARLHALWALVGNGALDPPFHLKLLAHSDSAYRAWGVRAAGNAGDVTREIRERIMSLARDRSPDVQLQVAIASRKIKDFDALPVLSEVLARCGQDKLIPSIAWNNLHPLLETESARFVSLQKTLSPALAALSPRIIDRILSSQRPDAPAAAALIKVVAAVDDEHAMECLAEVSSKLEALSATVVVQLKTQLRPVLQDLLARKPDTPLILTAQLLGARLGLVQIDPAVVRARFTSSGQSEGTRLQALNALVAFRDSGLLAVLPEVLTSSSPGFNRRVFAALGQLEEPKLGDVLLREYPKLAPELQPLAIDLMMQREPWARKLLDAVLANKLPQRSLNANHLRKILESNDRDALWAVEKAFGKVREERNPERENVVAEMGAYFREHPGDPQRGQTVFRNFCAQCHTIYGEGGKLGPDITENGRASFEQLLSNVFDPSLVIGPGYQVVTVVTTDGRNLTGLIGEDNEQRIVVRMPGEGEETVPRSHVKYTRVSKLSMMPEGIEALLSKDDLADLFAFLALDKPSADPGAKLIPGAPPPNPREPAKPTSRIRVESTPGKLIVRSQVPGSGRWIDLLTYVMETNSRPYLHPVNDASGQVVLSEDRPADHPWQHGIFTGFHRVNGINYWKEDEGNQRFVRLLDLQESPDRVSWRALVELVPPDGKAVLAEEDSITIHAPESPDTFVIDFDLLLRAKEKDVTFGKFFVGGLAVRMPWDKSNPRQTHLNANGLRDAACEQQRAAWCSVERPFGNERFGIAVFDHPDNENHPSGWRADEQGLINPNVSALGDWSLSAKQERVFRYRLLVYKGSATQEQLAARFMAFGHDSRGAVQEVAEPATTTPKEVLAGLRKFFAKTARADGSFANGIDPQYRGMSDSAYSDLAAVTYAVTLHKTFGWKLPHEEATRHFLLSRQQANGDFFNVAGTVDPKSAEGRVYNTTQGIVALNALGSKPRYDPLRVFEEILQQDYKTLPAYSTSFFPLAYLAYGRPIPREADLRIRALMVQAADGYVNNHIAATFHAAHYYRLIGEPTPMAKRIIERALRDQKPDGSWFLNMPSRDRHATFDAVFTLRQLGHDRADCRAGIERAARWALSCRNSDGGFGHFPGSPSDADANYFQIGTLVMAGYVKSVEPLPADPHLLSWGHLMPVTRP